MPDGTAAMEPGAGDDETPPGDLPAVEALVRQLRPELLATMEELFRAQWSGVKRLRAEELERPWTVAPPEDRGPPGPSRAAD